MTDATVNSTTIYGREMGEYKITRPISDELRQELRKLCPHGHRFESLVFSGVSMTVNWTERGSK